MLESGEAGWGKRLHWQRVYDALRRKGYSKTRAGKTSNAMSSHRRQGQKASSGRRMLHT